MKTLALVSSSRYPVTGTELMNITFKLSKGLWKPSPGSVYYVLRELREEGYIAEIFMKEKGERAYIITEKGKNMLKELKESLKKDLKKQAVLLSILMDMVGIEDKVEAFKKLIA